MHDRVPEWRIVYPAIAIPDWSDMIDKTDVVGRRRGRYRRKTIKPDAFDAIGPDVVPTMKTSIILPIDNGIFESCTSDSFSKL